MIIILLIAVITLAGCSNSNNAQELPVKLHTAIQLAQTQYDTSELLFKMVADDQYCMSVSAQKVVSVRPYCVATRSVKDLACTIVCELAHVNGGNETDCVNAKQACLITL